ncbi:hypothetical protein [Candidatus Bathycorpusculum sp.]|uniref:hypothetical protein n=1 Tax=Candidatus Bathycorpusculum sp. TaxID=2994959 RepID=UPI0028186F45|nr:hypothetical protein [Candidatus Termitimicrobium sp.]
MPRKKYEESVGYLFEQRFGKPLSDFNTYTNTVETLADTTKKDYYSRLAKFFLWLGEDPDQVIANRKTQIKADDETADYYERKVRVYKKMLEETQTGRSVKTHIGRIQGFFSNNSKKFSLDLGTMKYSKKRKTDKFSPDNAMCREIYSFCESPRDRLLIAIAFQNGVAPIDIAENDWSTMPTEPFKYYKGCREKTGEIWHGATTPEIAQEFAAYKKIRGEVLKSKLNPKKNEPFFKGREGFLDSTGISQIISTLIKKAGYDNITGFSPKSLRDGFEDALVDAEILGKTKEAMMGHVGDIEHQYGGDDRLKPRVEEAMQKTYKFLMLTEVVNTNGKSAQKISDLDNAVVESQKEIAALKTINSSLTDRLAKTEDEMGVLKILSITLCKKEMLQYTQEIEILQRALSEGTAEDPEDTAKEIEVYRAEIIAMEKAITRLERSA